MYMRNACSIVGIMAGVIFSSSLALAQVFQPRPSPPPPPAQLPMPAPA